MSSDSRTTSTYETLLPRGTRKQLFWTAVLAERSSRSTLLVEAAVEPDWIALESARANRWSDGVRLMRAPLACPQRRNAVAAAQPEIIIGNACRRYDPDHVGETATQQATDIVTYIFYLYGIPP